MPILLAIPYKRYRYSIFRAEWLAQQVLELEECIKRQNPDEWDSIHWDIYNRLLLYDIVNFYMNNNIPVSITQSVVSHILMDNVLISFQIISEMF